MYEFTFLPKNCSQKLYTLQLENFKEENLEFDYFPGILKYPRILNTNP